MPTNLCYDQQYLDKLVNYYYELCDSAMSENPDRLMLKAFLNELNHQQRDSATSKDPDTVNFGCCNGIHDYFLCLALDGLEDPDLANSLSDRFVKVWLRSVYHEAMRLFQHKEETGLSSYIWTLSALLGQKHKFNRNGFLESWKISQKLLENPDYAQHMREKALQLSKGV